MLTTEHILLEADDRKVPALEGARTIHASLEVHSHLRRCALQLRLIDYYYLSVRSDSPSVELEYVLDLRFVGAPRLSKHIAWRWITGSLVLLAVVAGMAVQIGSSPTPWWKHHWLGPWAAVTVTWALTTLMAAHRTTETLQLLSTHGQARLLEFTGGLGTLRVVPRFMAKLAAHLRLAWAARRRTKAEHLRDEMREHQRLRDIGVLTTEEYEAAKVRILAQHSPRTPARAKPLA